MIDFYDSNKANRAINTYLDFVGSEQMENKELLILTMGKLFLSLRLRLEMAHGFVQMSL